MFATKLLLVSTVLIGLVAEQCDLGDIAVEEIADKITVTNASKTEDAFVTVELKLSDEERTIRAGQSVTILSLASPSYTATVAGWGGPEYIFYANRLYALRDKLIGLTQTPEASGDTLTNAWTDLGLVQDALAQVKGLKGQSCGGKLKSGVTAQVTVSSIMLSDGTSVWSLDCG